MYVHFLHTTYWNTLDKKIHIVHIRIIIPVFHAENVYFSASF